LFFTSPRLRDDEEEDEEDEDDGGGHRAAELGRVEVKGEAAVRVRRSRGCPRAHRGRRGRGGGGGVDPAKMEE
jgi:hypothetical protein